MARKPTITQQQIIDTALDCFLEKGFEETTFKQITDKLGVSQPALYQYFNNKMDLLIACSLASAEKGRSYIDSQINPKDNAITRLEQYIEANFTFFKKSPKEAFALAAIYFFSLTHPEVRAIYQQIQIKSIERLEAVLMQISYEKGQKLFNSLRLAEMIQSFMVGETYKKIYLTKKEKRDEKDEYIMKYLKILIDSSFIH